MKRKITAVVVCVVVLGIAGGQSSPELKSVVPSLLVAGTGQAVEPLPVVPTLGANDQQSIPNLNIPSPAPVVVPTSFDALVAELKSLRTQKAEIERKEKSLTEALMK